MFNCKRELSQLTHSLGLKPGLHVVTGPVNSGKSLLLEKITELFKNSHVPVEPINLRSVSFELVDSLVFGLRDATNSWLQQFCKAAEYYSFDVGAYGFSAKLEIHQRPHSSPLTRLSDLLEQIEKKLPPYTFWRGTKAPILIIDEASELRALLKDSEGKYALHNLLKWVVLNTKEQRRFHTVFGSSDSFSHLAGKINRGSSLPVICNRGLKAK